MNICITGASKGLGRLLAKDLLARGHAVWGVARSSAELESLAKESTSGTFLWSTLDLAGEKVAMQWADQMRAKNFIPDIVILNASVQLDDMKDSYDHALGHDVLQVNLEGALRCIEALLSDMLARKSGRFVAIASTVALRPSPRSASYAASKAGLAMAMRTFAQRYRPQGIEFATAYLGPIQTQMWEGKKSILVPSPEKAAHAVGDFAVSRSNTLYYPWLSTTLLRVNMMLPDSAFSSLSSKILH